MSLIVQVLSWVFEFVNTLWNWCDEMRYELFFDENDGTWRCCPCFGCCSPKQPDDQLGFRYRVESNAKNLDPVPTEIVTENLDLVPSEIVSDCPADPTPRAAGDLPISAPSDESK